MYLEAQNAPIWGVLGAFVDDKRGLFSGGFASVGVLASFPPLVAGVAVHSPPALSASWLLAGQCVLGLPPM